MGELSGMGGQGIQNQKLAGDHAVNTPSDAKTDAPTDAKADGGEVDAKAKADGGEVDAKPKKDAPKGIETDVEGIYADGIKGDVPVFDVSPEEFNNNMKMDRRRLRFKQGSKAAEYMRNTRYNRPFWIRNSQDGYMRKISK